MIKKLAIFSLCVTLLSSCSNTSNTGSEAADHVKELVNRAVGLIEEQGKTAFPQMNKADWREGDPYVFVIDLKGELFVNPGRPELVGTPQINMRDAVGTYIIKDFIKVLQEKNSAWFEYHWIEPGNEEMCNKRAYLRKAQSRNDGDYIVGSGYCAEV